MPDKKIEFHPMTVEFNGWQYLIPANVVEACAELDRLSNEITDPQEMVEHCKRLAPTVGLEHEQLNACYFLCIREVYDRCLYLRPKKGCTAYDHRPIVCREHPFDLTLDDDDRKIVEIEMNDICDCSRTLDGKVSRTYIKKIHRDSLAQDEAYSAKVRRWNRRKGFGTEKEFLEFMGLR